MSLKQPAPSRHSALDASQDAESALTRDPAFRLRRPQDDAYLASSRRLRSAPGASRNHGQIYFHSWPLRAKLVALTALLLTASLAIVGIATSAILSQYLSNQVDEQLLRIVGNTALLQAELAPTDTPSDYYVLVRYDDGRVDDSVWEPTEERYGIPNIPDTPPSFRRSEADRDGPYTPPSPQLFTVDSIGGAVNTRWRVAAAPVPRGTGNIRGRAVMYVALPLASVNEATTMLIRTLVLTGLGLLATGGAAAFWLVNRSLKPLQQIEQTAAAIAGGDLTQRVNIDAAPSTELGSLQTSLNTMLAQIEASFAAQQASQNRMRQFVSDASHELRTPLATIRGYSELYRMGAVPPDGVPDTMGRIEDSARRMGLLVEDLLTLARLDEGRPLKLQPVDLVALANDVATDLHALDPTRTVQVLTAPGGRLSSSNAAAVETTTLRPSVEERRSRVSKPRELLVLADRERLHQVLTNLVGNVARYTPVGSPVEIILSHDATTATIQVRDHGPGLQPGEEQRIFERFYRSDDSRSREAGGTGLGLAIVAAIIGAHHGTVRANQTPGGGLTVTITLPTT